MIELYFWTTDNGYKARHLMEESGLDYIVKPINLLEREQFNPEFLKISPHHKIPAIIDKEKNKSIFESGAIMLYLSNKHRKFLPKKYYLEVMQWFFFQISQVGPFLGQAHQFLYYNKGKSSFAEKKYSDYVKRVYKTLDQRLEKNKYLGIEYSLADIATWPWIARFEIHKVNIKKYNNVLKWYKLISKRPAVIKGYNVIGQKEEIPQP